MRSTGDEITFKRAVEKGPRLLVDSYGRRIRKLRVSLLDACNMRCFYCMPENACFMPSQKWLSPEEIFEICETLVNNYGLQQIRLTGGEPTLRPEFRQIVSLLSSLPLQKLALTTNASRLMAELPFLKESLCQNINISLDSLRRERFNQITRRAFFDDVMQAIHLTREMNFKLKINVVLMRGKNSDELLDFVDFSARTGIEVRFLELMRIGQANAEQDLLFMSAKEAIGIIEQQCSLIPISVEKDSTSFNFKTHQGASIGFIASESQPFCGNCSRWRLSADGFLRACLMSEKGISVKGLEKDEYPAALSRLLPMKPNGRIVQLNQDMNQIGG